MSAAVISERLNNSGRSWSMRAGDAGPETSGIFLLLLLLLIFFSPFNGLFCSRRPSFGGSAPLTHLDTFMFSDAPP